MEPVARHYLKGLFQGSEPERCRAAGLTGAQIVFKRKHELALELIEKTRAHGLRFQRMGFDGLYGSDPALQRTVGESGDVFVGDVHKDQHVYLKDP